MKRLVAAVLFTSLPLLGACVIPNVVGTVRGNVANAGSRLGTGLVQKATGQEGEESKDLDALLDVLADPMKMSPSNEYYLGRTAVATILAKRYDNRVVGLKGKGAKARAEPDFAYVQMLAQTLLEAASRDTEKDDRLPSSLKVAVVRDDAPNAWSTPGGYTVVTTGLLSMVKSEDELAAVLAHELAHIVRGHGLRALHDGKAKAYLAKQASGLLKGLSGGAAEDEIKKGFSDFVSGLLDVLVKGYPPAWEYEADRRGARIAADAGYDPKAMGGVIERLAKWRQTHGTGEGIARTHPPEKERLARLEASRSGARGEAPAKRYAAVRARRFRRSVPLLLRSATAAAR